MMRSHARLAVNAVTMAAILVGCQAQAGPNPAGGTPSGEATPVTTAAAGSGTIPATATPTASQASATPRGSIAATHDPAIPARYELPNLGVAVTVPGDLRVRTALVDTLAGVEADPKVDVADYAGQLELSPLLVSSLGGIGLVGFTDDGATMVTVSATQAEALDFDVKVPAGHAHVYPDETPGDGPDRVAGYLDLPADDFMLGVQAWSVRRNGTDLEDLVRSVLGTAEVLGAPATTPGDTAIVTGDAADPVMSAWLPDTLAGLPVTLHGFRGRYAMVHPVFDGRAPSPLALLCGQLTMNPDDLSLVAAIAGGNDRSGPAELRGCRVRGATTAAWLPLLATGLERVDHPLTAFSVPGASSPSRVVVAGQAIFIVTATSDALADSVLSDLPTTEIPADAPLGD